MSLCSLRHMPTRVSMDAIATLFLLDWVVDGHLGWRCLHYEDTVDLQPRGGGSSLAHALFLVRIAGRGCTCCWKNVRKAIGSTCVEPDSGSEGAEEKREHD